MTLDEQVILPPGVADGQKLKVKGMGHASDVFLGVPGDLLLNIKVKPHELFKREDLHLISELPISISQAILGCKTTVETLEGKINVDISPGVTNGDTLVLKNFGVQPFHPPEHYDVNSIRGDHIFNIKVEIPTNMTERQKEILREF